MSTFTSSITNILNSGYITPLTSSQNKSSIVEAIKSGTIDSVNFSKESQNLLSIANIDTMLDGIFGLPSTLSDVQKTELEGLRTSLDGLFPTTSSQLQSLNIDTIIKNLGLSRDDSQEIKSLTDEITQYITQMSITNLFGDSSSTDFRPYSSGFSQIFSQNLTTEETNSLGKLSIQLNRLIFPNNNSDITSYLNTYNELYNLNNPTDQQLQDATSLLTQRNTLLSSILQGRATENYIS